MTTPRQRVPLYWRILRLRRLRPRASVTFLLFEGSIILAILLALADVVDWPAAWTIPVAVAVMVKLNDVIAANLDLRQLAEAQLRTPRPLEGRRVGVSRVPRPARGVAFVPRPATPPEPLHPDQPMAADEAPHPDGPHPEGPDRRSRGNQGRFDP